MAYHDTHTTSLSHTARDAGRGLWQSVKSVASVIGAALVAGSTANRRLKLVEKLSAKSDEELAALGIRREDIVRRVFIDMLDV